jgi:hypothetical protein
MSMAPRTADGGLVCRSETEVGSHRTKRVCRTPEQMAAERAAAREALQKRSGETSAGET